MGTNAMPKLSHVLVWVTQTCWGYLELSSDSPFWLDLNFQGVLFQRLHEIIAPFETVFSMDSKELRS